MAGSRDHRLRDISNRKICFIPRSGPELRSRPAGILNPVSSDPDMASSPARLSMACVSNTISTNKNWSDLT